MNFNLVPKASEAIKAIQGLIEKHGDLPICAQDADTDWLLRIGVVFKPGDEEGPDRFEIRTDYSERPKGLIGEEDPDGF